MIIETSSLFRTSINVVFRCSVKHVMIFSVIVFVVAVVIAGIVLTSVILTSKKQVKLISKNAYLRWNPVGITVAGVTGVAGNTSDKFVNPTDWYWITVMSFMLLISIAIAFNSFCPMNRLEQL